MAADPKDPKLKEALQSQAEAYRKLADKRAADQPAAGQRTRADQGRRPADTAAATEERRVRRPSWRRRRQSRLQVPTYFLDSLTTQDTIYLSPAAALPEALVAERPVVLPP